MPVPIQASLQVVQYAGAELVTLRRGGSVVYAARVQGHQRGSLSIEYHCMDWDSHRIAIQALPAGSSGINDVESLREFRIESLSLLDVSDLLPHYWGPPDCVP
jgi:hypothetical protein